MPIRPSVDMPVEINAFLSALYELQNQYLGKNKYAQLELSDNIINTHLSEGHPLDFLIPIPIEPNHYEDIFRAIGELVVEHRPLLKDDIKRICEGDINFKELAQKSKDQDGDYLNALAVERGWKPELLVFIAEQALRPFYRAFAEKLWSGVLDSKWRRNYCPVCGRAPSIARLSSQDGIRFLHCEHCGIDWSYQRLSCVYCGNDDHKSLNYFTVEEQDGYQIHVCETCRGYIKVFDERIIGSALNWDVADHKTIYLDILAQKRGYNKARNYRSLH